MLVAFLTRVPVPRAFSQNGHAQIRARAEKTNKQTNKKVAVKKTDDAGGGGMRKGTQTFATKKEVGETNQFFIGTFDFHTAEISRTFLYRISLILVVPHI